MHAIAITGPEESANMSIEHKFCWVSQINSLDPEPKFWLSQALAQNYIILYNKILWSHLKLPHSSFWFEKGKLFYFFYQNN